MKAPQHFLFALLAAALATGIVSCFHDDDDDSATPTPTVGLGFGGRVVSPTGKPVSNAKVYLIPADDVESMPDITGASILDGTAEPHDEPLEDLVRTKGDSYPSARTNANGRFQFPAIPIGYKFVFVQPAKSDKEFLPGGSLCREAVSDGTLRGRNYRIEVSSSPPDGTPYIGTSTCLLCHPSYETEKAVAHRLGFRVPGVSSGLQDTSEHPEIDNGLAFFTEAASFLQGTRVWFYDYDDTRGFDKFRTSLSDPTATDAAATVYASMWLWKDTSDGEYKITIANIGNPADPANAFGPPAGSPLTRSVKLTYGGAVYKQRYMIEWAPTLDGSPDRKGLYPILQFQEEGDEEKWDRTRRQFRDYHLDFIWDDRGTPQDETDDLLKDPSIDHTITRNCMACHAADYTQFTDAVTGEVLCDTLEDPFGEYDIDGDTKLNDLNIGCENCHGPGGAHLAARGGDFILSPELLSPSREVMMCGRCHDRQKGADALATSQPLNAAGEFPLPGISRDQYLTEYVSRKGPSQSEYWPDFEHTKSHHMQAPDFLKSPHYRNDNELLTCSSCHNMHGGTGHPRSLIEDPGPGLGEPPLCMVCHADDIPGTEAHTLEKVGFGHLPVFISCVDCHMPKTAKTGAGSYGALLGTPTGTSGDDDITYFENDITSHLFAVPRKDNVGVKGVQPAQAMPIPYTRACGGCHDPSPLPNPDILQGK